MFLRKFILLSFLLVFQGVIAQETIKTMFYNVFNYPSAPTPNRAQILSDILDEYQADIFMVCEVETQAGAVDILNDALNNTSIIYEKAPFVINQSSNSPLQQLVYFKSSKFSLELSEVIVNNVRDINRYKLKLLSEDHQTNPLYIDLYVAHLKSSPGPANRQIRLEMVQEFTATLGDLDPNSYVIFAGDLNLYNATEPAYQELLSVDNPITFVDPLDAPGAWQDNPNFAYLHTQSTRLSNAGFGGGAGAGLDDRFDFILISENMLDSPELMYVEDTYKAFGNNGNCLNNRIDSADCDGDFGQALRSNLYWMSDHLPVVMNLQTDRVLSTNTSITNVELIKFPYGNMTNQNLAISVDPSIQQEIEFNIFNVLGQNIKSIPNNGQTDYSVDVSTFPQGIYYLTTTTQNIKTFKFIKK
jgi:endonuclease/exonuclease/phosphatase family metal-dependent hydrolase